MSQDVSPQFVRNLTDCQNKLYAYLLSLSGEPDRARDILQDTNVVLWTKAHEFEAGTNFLAWAYKVAYFEVLADRRRRQRDRHVFDEQTLEEIAVVAQSRVAKLDERAVALEECLQRLSEKQRKKIVQRYLPGGSVKAMADDTGASPGAVANALYRIRASLLECLRAKLVSRGIVT